jgi:hypothetical protein
MSDDSIVQPEDGAENEASSLVQLETALSELHGLLDSYQLRHEHYPGDLTLWGFAMQAWEGGTAVLLLNRDSELGHVAFPNARAAFEAGEDALLLATAPDYDIAGAQARVFERLEQGDIRSETREARGDPRSTDSRYSDIAALITKDAEALDRVAPNAGDGLRSALARLLPKFEAASRGKGKHPGHWFEKSRRRIAEELGSREGSKQHAARLIAIYASLSRYSHPRARTEGKERSFNEANQLVLRPLPFQRQLVVEVAIVGVRMALDAIYRVHGEPKR